jgi:hypothetical protein
MDSIDGVNEFIINSIDHTLDEMILYDFVNIERILGDNIDIYLISHGEIPEISTSIHEFDHWINSTYDLGVGKDVAKILNTNNQSILNQANIFFDTWALADLTASEGSDIQQINDERIGEVMNLIIDHNQMSFVDIVGQLHAKYTITEIYGMIHYLLQESMIKNYNPDIELSDFGEIPVLFMATHVYTGVSITSVQFGQQDINQSLLSGLISAIQTMTQSIFDTKGVIENITYDEFTIAFKFHNDVMYSYVFKGNAFSLPKKFKKFTQKLSELRWLNEFGNNVVISHTPTQVKQLEDLIMEYFSLNALNYY